MLSLQTNITQSTLVSALQGSDFVAEDRIKDDAKTKVSKDTQEKLKTVYKAAKSEYSKHIDIVV